MQVYFPYLRDTYEYVQMGVVFERLNRFLEMLHDLRLPRTGQASELDVSRQIHERADSVSQPYRKPLKSGFPIPEELMTAVQLGSSETRSALHPVCLTSSPPFGQSPRW